MNMNDAKSFDNNTILKVVIGVIIALSIVELSFTSYLSYGFWAPILMLLVGIFSIQRKNKFMVYLTSVLSIVAIVLMITVTTRYGIYMHNLSTIKTCVSHPNDINCKYFIPKPNARQQHRTVILEWVELSSLILFLIHIVSYITYFNRNPDSIAKDACKFICM